MRQSVTKALLGFLAGSLGVAGLLGNGLTRLVSHFSLSSQNGIQKLQGKLTFDFEADENNQALTQAMIDNEFNRLHDVHAALIGEFARHPRNIVLEEKPSVLPIFP